MTPTEVATWSLWALVILAVGTVSILLGCVLMAAYAGATSRRLFVTTLSLVLGGLGLAIVSMVLLLIVSIAGPA